MLHILWVLIKILLILLAVLLILVLAAVLAVLLVPVRYGVSVKKKDGFMAYAGFTWLLHLLSVPVSFTNGQFAFRVKICGFTVLGDKESSKGKGQVEDSAGTDKEVLPNDTLPADDTPGSVDEASVEENHQPIREISVIDETPTAESLPPMDEQPPVETLPEDKTATDDMMAEDEVPLDDDTPEPDENAQVRSLPPPEPAGETQEWSSPASEPVRRRWKNPLQLIRGIWQSIKRLFANLMNSLRNIKESVDSLKSRLEYYKRLWYDDHTQGAFRHLKKEAFYLFGHIRPRKVRGWLYFGFDDPSTTGQVLGILCILQAMSGNHLTVEADFQNPVFEGEFELKGHVRAVHFLKALLVLIMDKHCRITFRRFRKN